MHLVCTLLIGINFVLVALTLTLFRRQNPGAFWGQRNRRKPPFWQRFEWLEVA